MPWVSPGRLDRVVTETDIIKLGSRSKSNRDRVVLPAPEGEDNINITPRRRIPVSILINPFPKPTVYFEPVRETAQ